MAVAEDHEGNAFYIKADDFGGFSTPITFFPIPSGIDEQEMRKIIEDDLKLGKCEYVRFGVHSQYNQSWRNGFVHVRIKNIVDNVPEMFFLGGRPVTVLGEHDTLYKPCSVCQLRTHLIGDCPIIENLESYSNIVEDKRKYLEQQKRNADEMEKSPTPKNGPSDEQSAAEKAKAIRLLAAMQAPVATLHVDDVATTSKNMNIPPPPENPPPPPPVEETQDGGDKSPDIGVHSSIFTPLDTPIKKSPLDLDTMGIEESEYESDTNSEYSDIVIEDRASTLEEAAKDVTTVKERSESDPTFSRGGSVDVIGPTPFQEGSNMGPILRQKRKRDVATKAAKSRKKAGKKTSANQSSPDIPPRKELTFSEKPSFQEGTEKTDAT